MKYSREYILRRAFDVFMDKGYDSTSISVLQQELEMSRGAMYRYFKNKEELFVSVVDEYFFRIFVRILNKTNEDLTVSEMIDAVYRRQKLMLYILMRANINRAVFLNYTALLIQAAKHYPDFIVKFREIEQCIVNSWRTALHNGVKAGEIRADVNIDILCLMFTNISLRESSSDEDNESRFTFNIMQDMERRRDVINYLFSLIKT